MRYGLCMAVVLLTAGAARAETLPLDAWSDSILSQLPFHDGVITRETYGVFADAFVAEKKAYLDSVYARLAEKAHERGNTAMVEKLGLDHDRLIANLHRNVDLAGVSIFAALSPEADGTIRRPEARDIVMRYARAADLDDNGQLEDYEQHLAEWCLATGHKVADKADRRAVAVQLKEVERSM